MVTSEPTATPPLATDGGGNEIAVHVDHGMCSGTRNCERYYPDIFVVNRDKAWIKSGIEWASADVALLKEVESACPWAAIEVEAPAD